MFSRYKKTKNLWSQKKPAMRFVLRFIAQKQEPIVEEETAGKIVRPDDIYVESKARHYYTHVFIGATTGRFTHVHKKPTGNATSSVIDQTVRDVTVEFLEVVYFLRW